MTHPDDKPAPGDEYGHDETYRPGYHKGGSRFGFFNGEDESAEAPAGSAKPPKTPETE